jgi:hypothetical protein
MLRETLSKLASTFAEEVMDVLREEFSGGNPAQNKRVKLVQTKVTRRVRRSAEDIANLVPTIVAAVKKAGVDGVRAEVLNKSLGIDKTQLYKPIELALKQKLFRVRGSKRTTTYFVSTSVIRSAKKSKKSAKKKAVKKAAPKRSHHKKK